MSSSLARSGLLASTDGSAARKECPEMKAPLSPMIGLSSFTRQVLRDPDVRSKLEVNSKTGFCGLLHTSYCMKFSKGKHWAESAVWNPEKINKFALSISDFWNFNCDQNRIFF